tara:strand:- start:248 stop:925 length:678 start_codon:yes stop_codon:yes gene_type:complete
MKTDNFQKKQSTRDDCQDKVFNGLYGSFYITDNDKTEVRKYRLSIFSCGLSLTIGLGHWFILGSSWAWIWLLIFTLSLGLALNWIHIYILSIHNSLKILWFIGFLGLCLMSFLVGIDEVLPTLKAEPKWLFLIGPLFASLTGLGFKEFFCFRRLEALGITIILPVALIFHMSQLINYKLISILIGFSALLLVLLGVRKFGNDPALDVGDKSIFKHLKEQRLDEAV